MYDVIVIGSGPAGYVAAERAGEMGRQTLLIERDEHLGGVCLNSGCIPTKSMLYCAKAYHHARHGAAFGVHAENVAFDYDAVRTRTVGIQNKLRSGIVGLMKRHKVEVAHGAACLLDRQTVAVGDETYKGRNVLICTGSRPFLPPIPGLTESKAVLTNEGFLSQDAMPENLCIIGGGVIGTEFASLYATVGRRVEVIEMLPEICGPTDTELAKTVRKELEKRGVTFHLKASVTRVEDGTVTFTDKKDTEQTLEADRILVATGRAVNVEDIGLEAAGVDFDRRGIKVNDRAETNVPGIYAAGDVTGRWQLAHFASRQATVAITNMFGGSMRCREDAVPAVVYTDPEIASVGLTQRQCRERGTPVRTAKFNLGANGRYLAETDGGRGVCKLVVGADHGAILGVHMVGPGVSEMIAAAAVAVEGELRAADLAEVIFPHPTISEAIHDATFGLAE